MKLYLSKNDRLEFFSMLAPMVSAGIPLVEAVNDAGKKAKKHVRAVSRELVMRLSSGATLSASMAALPQAFDPVSVNLISAAEESGTLEQSLKDLGVSIQKEITFEEQIRSALIYPLFVFGVFCFVLVVMLLFVVPRVATVFERLRIPIPASTQLLISLSLALQTYFSYIAIFVIASVFGLLVVLRSRPKIVAYFFSSLPFFSGIALQLDLARFSRTAGLLLRVGVPFPASIELADDSIRTPIMRAAVNRGKQMVNAGQPFSESLSAMRWELPAVYIRMIEAGEKSGTLATSFQEAGEYFEHQSQRTLQAITVLLEPIMIVTIGLFVGGMMLSIVAPIYGLISTIAGG